MGAVSIVYMVGERLPLMLPLASVCVGMWVLLFGMLGCPAWLRG